MLKKILLTMFVAVAVMSPAVQAWAESVQAIQVQGNARVEASTVKSYLGVRKGDTYSPSKARDALKALYATGLFDNVEVSWDNGTLTVKVSENPIVNKVVFEGNDALSNDRLKDLVKLRSRAVFTAGKAQEDVKEILAAYRQTGRFLAQVDPQIIRRDQNRVDVIYKINEGRKTRIASIDFVGNHEYSDADLRDVISTKITAWYRFLSGNDSYDPDRLEVDKEILRRFYLKSGYADFRVISAVAELSKDKSAFFITFTVTEGPVYSFGKVDVKLSDRTVDVNLDDLRKELTVKENDRYDASRIDHNIDVLVDKLGQKGYAFLDVVPVLDKDDTTHKMNVTFDIRPGPRVYVNRINIKGNTRTRDDVIRREMRLAEGDAFSTTKLLRSKERLQRLDFFDNVELKRRETGDPDRLDLDVNVAEKSTGEFNIGAGFSSYEGVLATTNVRERNFLGRGQTLDLSFAISGERQDFDFGFTEPWFMNQELSAGIKLFNQRRQYQDQSSYDQDTTGGAFTLGFPIGEFSQNSSSLGYRGINITNVDASASQFVKNEVGKRNSITVGNTLSYDSRDNVLQPNYGTRLSWSVDVSGFGSDTNYVRNQVSGSYYMQLADQWVLSFAGRAGYLADLDGNTPLFENFNMGGPTLRGFDRAGIGPRDSITGDALGGTLMAGHNVELRFPLPGMDQVGVNGLLFSDGGVVTEFQNSNSTVKDSGLYRVSVGTGFFWRSPLGPLRFEFGFPVVKSSEDRTQVFSFNFGTQF